MILYLVADNKRNGNIDTRMVIMTFVGIFFTFLGKKYAIAKNITGANAPTIMSLSKIKILSMSVLLKLRVPNNIHTAKSSDSTKNSLFMTSRRLFKNIKKPSNKIMKITGTDI